MKKTRYEIYLELEEQLPKMTLREISHSIRMQRFVLFLYKKSTLFFFFLPIFMGSFIYYFVVDGLIPNTLTVGCLDILLYLPFYIFVILGMIFSERAEDYKEIKDWLEILENYRNDITSESK